MIMNKHHTSLILSVAICKMGMIPQGNVQRIKWGNSPTLNEYGSHIEELSKCY